MHFEISPQGGIVSLYLLQPVEMITDQTSCLRLTDILHTFYSLHCYMCVFTILYQ